MQFAARAVTRGAVFGVEAYRNRTRRDPRRHLRPSNPGRRAVVLLVVLFLLLLPSIHGLVNIQVLEAAAYENRGEGQRTHDAPIPAFRGTLYDAMSRPLAISLARKRVVADKVILLQNPETSTPEGLQRLGTRIEQAIDCADEQTDCREDLGGRLERADDDSRYVVLAESSAPDAAEQLAEDVPGIVLEDTLLRSYPQGAIGRSTVGWVRRSEAVGVSGLERRYEDELRGTAGSMVAERNPKGETIVSGRQVITPAKDGDDVVTTLDAELQNEVQRLLTEGLVAAQGARAVAVVGRPSTGDLLAVEGVERDPDTGEVGSASSNLAFHHLFQPGSFVKSITIASAFNAGTITPDQQIPIPKQLVMNEGTDWRKAYTDAESNLPPSMIPSDVLAHSSNLGTIQIARGLGEDRLSAALSDFGLGRPTPIGFPAEQAGSVPPAPWANTDLASVSIGTSVAATAVQMWGAMGVLANKGVYMAPRLVSAIGPSGDHHDLPLAEGRRVISDTAATQTLDGLRKVMTEGTGKRLAIPGYDIAAKSGTSPKPKQAGQTATVGVRYTTTFSGYFPADHPEYLITVIVDEPLNPSRQSGASAAGPVFRNICEYLIQSYHLAPAAQSGGGGGTGPIRARPAGTPSPEALAAAAAAATTSTVPAADGETTTDGATGTATAESATSTVPSKAPASTTVGSSTGRSTTTTVKARSGAGTTVPSKAAPTTTARTTTTTAAAGVR